MDDEVCDGSGATRDRDERLRRRLDLEDEDRDRGHHDEGHEDLLDAVRLQRLAADSDDHREVREPVPELVMET